MNLPGCVPRLVLVSGLALIAVLSLAHAQPVTEYQPRLGQAGKNIVWVPTSQTLVDKILDMANVKANDLVIDLGSGDGRTVITAAKRGAKAIGIEYNPDLVELSKRNAARERVTDKVTFVKADIFQIDFSKATVITLFLHPKLNLRLRPKILNMKPGVRVVSNSYDMGDWTPDKRDTVHWDECKSYYCTALFWIVPAKVQGTWKTPQGEFVLEQKYQMLSGTIKVGSISATIKDGKMTGDQIAFSADDTRYTGRVNGNAIEGISKSATRETKWQATRAD